MKVYQAINQVQKALAKCGISKDKKNIQQGYSFRGIDDVYNVLSPLLAEHGLCILPRVISREITERTTQKGSVMFYVTVECEFDFISAEDGTKHTVKTFGEAMDSADKATNKAMSAAYKYAAFQAFAIPTEGDNDADMTTPEPVKPAQPNYQQARGPSAPKLISYEEALALLDGCMDLRDVERVGNQINESWGHFTNPMRSDLRAKKNQVIESINNKAEA